MKTMKKAMTLLTALLLAMGVSAQKYLTASDVSFTSKGDAYSKERLKLDVYYPGSKQDCPVVVWFHGGGLEAGHHAL